MVSTNPANPLSTYDADTLSPLPSDLRHGLFAVSFFGYLSFISSITLFVYLTYRMARWRASGQPMKNYNQFLLLIYNLVLADIQQSLAFLLTSRWLVEDKIHVGTPFCFAEGWFVSTGDLASSAWIFAIALHTYSAIVRGYKVSYSTFVVVMGLLWLFIYTMAIIGIAIHPKDYYTRAGAWCWVNGHYETERLYLHYLWIFMAMFGTITIYSVLFISLHRRVKSTETSSTTESLTPHAGDRKTTARAARYMVIYPFVYVLCTLPLASGRAAAMAGRDVPYAYYCLAGAAITSNGWLDVILYAFTRRSLVFNSQPDQVDAGDLGTFGIGIYPHTKEWGTRTTIEGGVLAKAKPRNRDREHARKISSRSGSMDDLFANRVQGHIATKNTVKVESTQVNHSSDVTIGMKELRSPVDVRTPSKDTDADSWFESGSHKSRFSN